VNLQISDLVASLKRQCTSLLRFENMVPSIPVTCLRGHLGE